VWWLLWLGSAVVGYYILFTFHPTGATIDQFISISWILFAAVLIRAIDAVLAITVVLGIDTRQQQKSRNPRTAATLSPIVSGGVLPTTSKPTDKIAAPAESAETFFKHGTASLNKGNYERAITEYDLAIQVKPDYAEAYLQRGLAYYRNHRLVRAMDDLNRAAELRSLTHQHIFGGPKSAWILVSGNKPKTICKRQKTWESLVI
jgi:tetratricopeptide (TPR) repeat protein